MCGGRVERKERVELGLVADAEDVGRKDESSKGEIVRKSL